MITIKPKPVEGVPVVVDTLASIKFPDVFAPDTNNGVAVVLVLFIERPNPADVIDKPLPELALFQVKALLPEISLAAL